MNEAILEGREKRDEMRLEFINHGCGGNLLGCIGQTNMSKFIYYFWMISFWDKSNEDIINFFQDVVVVKEVKSCFSQTIANNVSIFLIEFRRESIRSRRFVLRHLKQSSYNFLMGEREIKVVNMVG
ncbi:hypothetical protein LIER_10351 [Lithospermum erythrorhizon]|uniref:Uncharacterized protein n=1 Tax=Lithospermum erythrorhizon TaxID=34254 RepID=A0AAV3PL85_LITER